MLSERARLRTRTMQPWAIEEIWLRPAATLLVCAIAPFASARLLRAVLLSRPAGEDQERARQLAPLRQAAIIVGFAQLQLAWMAGVSALGPALVDAPNGGPSLAFGALCAAVAFVAGGIARRPEEPPDRRSSVLGVARLRLRLLAFLAGPLLVVIGVTRLPLAAGELQWVVVALALIGCVLGVAYAGLAVSLVTGALRPASAPVRAAAHEVARAEGTSLWLVLRLPTPGATFANAAALPWARTMVVSDALVELLSPDELRAVLAHEAGHLSEGPVAAASRIGVASVLVFGLAAGVPIGAAHGLDPWLVVLGAAALAVPALLLMKRFARRMEIRADERARATVGAAPLASALLALQRALLLPMTTGGERVHPDLYDRLRACGHDPGERPAPPRRRAGLAIGLTIAATLVAAVAAGWALTAIELEQAPEAGESAARWRLRIDPWDPVAMLAAGWAARERSTERALAWARQARRLGAPDDAALELEAEIYAARGDCERARATFDRALRARTEAAFRDPLAAPLELGGYHLPPSLLTECGPIIGP